MNLAISLFPEREPAEQALDRFAIALSLRLRRLPWLRRRAQQRLLDAVAAAAPAPMDDAALRSAACEACRAAYADRDPAAGARALALLSEAAFRALGLRPHRPQLLACWSLIEGTLVELDTGEGKTLTAGLGAAFAALAGVPAHVVTVNDYLARRDAETVAPLFALLGLSVGIVHGDVAQDQRAVQYQNDICYCTNKDLVFDYLRDRVNARGSASRAQLAVRQLHGEAASEPLRLRGLHFAIVDEADSVLVDEARTPLILSARREGQADVAPYEALLALARDQLEEGVHYALEPGGVELLAAGRAHLAELAEDGDRADEVWRTPWMLEHFAAQALRAIHLFRRDQHYVVHDGKVVIVDEFSGRMLPDRSWEQGLQQLVEVKEGCAPSGGNVTLARITYQSFFARYLRLSGMSGTIRETASEMAGVFGIACLRIEPNTRSRRQHLAPRVYADEAAKVAAVVAEVQACRATGRPVLVGTRSVRSSQVVSEALAQAGIGHRVLNALQNADEAELVASAGQPGAVTVATNMAGRGTDIRLAPEALAQGGLHVILTEWHESSRVDRQLYGRCARQGDPGSVRALVALDDELLQRHASGWLLRLAGSLNGRHWPVWAIEALRLQMQSTAERGNAAQRRRTLEQDRRLRRQLAFSGAPE
ncbi:MAG TPA: prepilin peptidase [Roseateles sp.]